MNIITDPRLNAVRHISQPDQFSVLKEPGCAALVFRRDFDAAAQSWINGLDPATLPRTRCILRPEELHQAALHACNASGTPDTAERATFLQDIATLGAQFAAMLGANWLRLRLDVVTTNSCRKFHIDAVTARLVCTYRGTGTQYGISPDGSAPQHIFTVPTSAPLLLRGTLWPELPRAGLLHRSPPIEGSGETRAVMVLDPINDPEEAV